MLLPTNAFPNVVNLALIPMPENPWLPTTVLVNVAFALFVKVVRMEKLLIAIVGVLLEKKLAFKTARLVELFALDALVLVLLKASAILE